MTDNRPVREVTTNTGHTVKMYEHITLGEQRQIQKVLLRTVKVQVKEGAEQVAPEISGDALLESQEEAVRLLVVELDGSAEQIFDRIMALRPEDGQEIMAAVEEATSGKNREDDAKK
jgi:hypothetical protein